MASYSPYSLPKYMFLDLPQDVIRSDARFRLRVHTLRCETVTWNPRSSPACDLCESEDDVQDEQHVIFYCTHPHLVSLRRRFASLFSETRVQDVFAFLHQNNNKLHFFLHELTAFSEFMSRLGWLAFFLWTLLSVIGLFLFLSELMDLFVAGRDQSAAGQPNNVAEGHSPL